MDDDMKATNEDITLDDSVEEDSMEPKHHN